MGFQQGLSGLNASAKNLDVIGHNIANSGTVGFKASRTEFAEMVAAAIGTSGGINAGIGVQVGAVAQQFTQGNITVTGNSMDVAINGNGFFMLQTADETPAYTRAGNFKLDNEGNLVTNSGEKVMGYVNGRLQPLTFPTSQGVPAKQTTEVKVQLNLSAQAKDAAADPITPRSTYGTSINVYDSQGIPTPLNMYFEKNGSNSWDIYDTLNDPKANPPVIGRFVGKLEMDGNGAIIGLTQPEPGATPTAANNYTTTGTKITRKADGTFAKTPVTWEWEAVTDLSTPPKTIDWTIKQETLGTPTAEPADFKLALTVDPSKANPNNPPTSFQVSLDLSKVTQFGTKFSVSDLTQDGYADGQLTGINIGADGTIMSSYSNGVTRAQAQIALASFRNTQGLTPIGNNNWVATIESGPAVPDKPGSGNLGALRAGALEDSNVDLTAELVNMMTAQRAYQANAQTIKTQDQVMSTLVNLR